MIFPESLEAAFGGANLHKELETAFRRHGINVLYDVPISEITPEEILSAKKHRINYDLLMLLPPFRGQAMIGKHGFTDESDFVVVDNFLRVQNLEKVYAVGDIAAFTGPKLAFMAVREAQVAAANIVSELQGGIARKSYNHDIALIIDEGGESGIFLHYGIWDNTLHGLKTGKMWSRMKSKHNQLWEVVRDG